LPVCINGLSRLTKLRPTTSNGQARPIRFKNFRIGPSLSNRIESGGQFEFESNLEASQVPNWKIWDFSWYLKADTYRQTECVQVDLQVNSVEKCMTCEESWLHCWMV